MNSDITYFAQTNWRSKAQVFGIKQKDRLLHTYIIGKTGTGKSSLIKTMLLQDIQAGRGVCLIDPHGDLATEVVNKIPEARKGDLLYFDMPDKEMRLKYNPFKRVSYEKRSLVGSGILEVFKKLFSDAWGSKLEHLLRNCILALLDQPSATVADIPAMLLDRAFRESAIEYIVNESIRSFWEKEFPHYTKWDLLPALNKLGGMLAYPVIKRVLIENPDEVLLRKAMDEQRIIIINLAKGSIGEDSANILGALFISSLSSGAFSRVDIGEEERKPFMVYLDEFHNFTTLSLINMLSELRKFKVGLILAHQYMYQLEDEIRWGVLGNAGTMIAFRMGVEDAQYFSKEFYPQFELEDLISLPNYNIYLKLMIDGVPSQSFSAITVDDNL